HFLGVEGGRGLMNTVEVEDRDELVEREHLALVRRCPTEQSEVVDDRSGKVSRVAVLLDRHRTMALRELSATRPQDQRKVRVDRLIAAAERSTQREDAVRRVEEIFAAQHVRDRHLEV